MAEWISIDDRKEGWMDELISIDDRKEGWMDEWMIVWMAS